MEDENKARLIRREKWKHARQYVEAPGRVCIMRLLGKRCVRYYPHAGLAHQCYPPCGDHTDVWKDQQGELVFTAQPYGSTADEVEATVDFCRKHGLRVRVDSWAWHNSGCIVVEFRKTYCRFKWSELSSNGSK